MTLLFIRDKKRIFLPNREAPIYIRANTSDIPVFEEIFLHEEYNFEIDIRPRLIIDGGAYVGYSTIFFAHRFPEAKIIAVEPAESNFQLLRENTSFYKNIEIIQSAIWSKNTFLQIENSGLGHWGFSVKESTEAMEGSFRGITIPEILKKYNYDKIDILKLDIEGSEKEVFLNENREWLHKVNVLIIELHDRFKSGCTQALFSAISQNNFTIFAKGENFIIKII
jgi:FkbM family methyltransferase